MSRARLGSLSLLVSLALVASCTGGPDRATSSSAPSPPALSDSTTSPAPPPSTADSSTAPSPGPVTTVPATLPRHPDPVVLPAPSPAAVTAGTPTQRAARLAKAIASDQEQAAVAGWLAVYDAAGIPVLDDAGRGLGTTGDDPIGPAYWQVWMTRGDADAGLRLADLAPALVEVAGPPPVADAILSSLRTAARSTTDPASAFLAHFVAARVRAVTPSVDLFASGVTADDVVLDLATAQLLSWAFFRTVLLTGAAGAAAPATGLRSDLDTQAGRRAPFKCSELLGDDVVTSWVGWLANKYAGGIEGVPFLPGLPQQIAKWFPGALSAETAGKVAKVIGKANLVAGLLTLLMQYDMIDLSPSAETLIRSNTTRDGATVPVRLDLSFDPSKIADGNNPELCALSFLLNAIGIGFAVPPGGPISGAEVVVEGRQGFGQRLVTAGSYVLLDANDLKQNTDSAGSVQVRVTGRGQKRDRSSAPVTRDREYSVAVSAQPGEVGTQQMLNLLLDGLTITGSGPAGLAGAVMDLAATIHWDFGEQVFPLKDVEAGWVLDDTTTAPNGAVSHYSAKNCDGLTGTWHIVIDNKPEGTTSFRVFWDITVDEDGNGKLTGEEHSTWDDGLKVDGVSTGTAHARKVDDESATLSVNYLEDVTFVDPHSIVPNQPFTREGERHTYSFDLRPATEDEC